MLPMLPHRAVIETQMNAKTAKMWQFRLIHSGLDGAYGAYGIPTRESGWWTIDVKMHTRLMPIRAETSPLTNAEWIRRYYVRDILNARTNFESSSVLRRMYGEYLALAKWNKNRTSLLVRKKYTCWASSEWNLQKCEWMRRRIRRRKMWSENTAIIFFI